MKTLASADIIVGGPPCTDFSIAGNMTLGHRANLCLKYAKLICTCKPRYFVLENVVQFRTVGKPLYAVIMKLLRKAGYAVDELVLDASDYGAATVRKRLFLVGVLGGTGGYFTRRVDG